MEAVWRHMLGWQRWHGFGCRFNIGHKLEPEAEAVSGSPWRLTNIRSLALAAAVPTTFLAVFWPEWADESE